jgi:rhamnosyltransferase subunit B
MFAWEAGANLGHTFPMAQIAKTLSQDGYQCCFAMRDIAYGRLALEGTSIPLLQAPVWPEHQYLGNQDGQASYVDILALIGFGDVEKLSAMLAAWNSLLDLVKPDVVVADHCPALMPLLQARKIASVAVGTGFTMPPLDYSSLPPLRADRGPLLPEQTLLLSLTTALAQFGLKAPNSLIEAFRSTSRFVFSFPELDAYRSWRREPLYLPPEPLPKFKELPIVPHLFVYAGPEFPDIEELAQVLGQLPFTVSCFLRDAPKALNTFLRIRGLTAYDQPPRLAELLPTVSHVMSQGGNFMSHAAMAAGRPHLILPIHGETRSNLDTLTGLGIARGLLFPFKGELRKQIEDFVGDANMYMKSRQWAMLVGKREQASGLDATVAAVRQCMSQVS